MPGSTSSNCPQSHLGHSILTLRARFDVRVPPKPRFPRSPQRRNHGHSVHQHLNQVRKPPVRGNHPKTLSPLHGKHPKPVEKDLLATQSSQHWHPQTPGSLQCSQAMPTSFHHRVPLPIALHPDLLQTSFLSYQNPRNPYLVCLCLLNLSSHPSKRSTIRLLSLCFDSLRRCDHSGHT